MKAQIAQKLARITQLLSAEIVLNPGNMALGLCSLSIHWKGSGVVSLVNIKKANKQRTATENNIDLTYNFILKPNISDHGSGMQI